MVGLLCFGAPLGLVKPALGQTPPSAEAPGSVPAEDNPSQGEGSKSETAELAAELSQQRAELANLREELQHKLAEETAAREAAEARARETARAAVESALKASQSVSGVEGLTLSGFVQTDLTSKQISENQLNSSTGAPLNEDRFFIRRARLRSAVDQGYFAGVFELDANTVNGTQVR